MLITQPNGAVEQTVGYTSLVRGRVQAMTYIQELPTYRNVSLLENMIQFKREYNLFL